MTLNSKTEVRPIGTKQLHLTFAVADDLMSNSDPASLVLICSKRVNQ